MLKGNKNEWTNKFAGSAFRVYIQLYIIEYSYVYYTITRVNEYNGVCVFYRQRMQRNVIQGTGGVKY